MTKLIEYELNDEIKIVVTEDVDEDYWSLDYLGEVTDKVQEYCIDRQRGVFYGKIVDEPDPPYWKHECEDWLENEDQRWMHAIYRSVKKHLYKNSVPIGAWKYSRLIHLAEQWIENNIPLYIFEKKWQEWDENFGMEVLAYDLRTPYDRNEYRFFMPEATKHVETVTAEEVKYALWDWKRYEDCGKSWWPMVIGAQVIDNGAVIGSASCGGIDSDGGPEYKKEIIEEEVFQALHEADAWLKKHGVSCFEKYDFEDVAKKVTSEALQWA